MLFTFPFSPIKAHSSFGGGVQQFVATTAIAFASVVTVDHLMGSDYLSDGVNGVVQIVKGVISYAPAYTASYFLYPPPSIVNDVPTAAKAFVIKSITMGIIATFASNALAMTKGGYPGVFAEEFWKVWLSAAAETIFRCAVDAPTQLLYGHIVPMYAIGSCAIGGTSHLLLRNASISEVAFGCYNFAAYKNFLGINPSDPLTEGLCIEGTESVMRAALQYLQESEWYANGTAILHSISPSVDGIYKEIVPISGGADEF